MEEILNSKRQGNGGNVTVKPFSACTDSIFDFYSLIKPLGVVKVGNCIISDDGLEFIIQVDKILQIQTWIPKDIFINWKPQSLEFSMDLGNFLDCVGIYSLSDNRMELSTSLDSSDFIMCIANKEISTRILLKKYDKLSTSELLCGFSDPELLIKIILEVFLYNPKISSQNG